MICNIPRPVFSIDQVTLISMVKTRRLNKLLPIRELRRYYPDFRVRTFKKHAYQSRIDFIAISLPLLELLIDNENTLGDYDITRIELAFDFPASTPAEAKHISNYITPNLDKKYPIRRKVYKIDDKKKPPTDIIPGPTTYWEDRSARTRIKGYCRHSKATGKPVFRLEWTLSQAGSINDKTGISRISDLLNYNSEHFFARNFRICIINKEYFKERFYPNTKMSAIRAFGFYQRSRAYRNPLSASDFELAKDIEGSTAQVKNALLLEKQELKNRRGRRNHWQRKIMGLNQHQINKLFEEIDLVNHWDY